MKFITLESENGSLDFGIPYCDVVKELEKNNIIHIKKFIPDEDLFNELMWLSSQPLWHHIEKENLKSQTLEDIKPNESANHKFGYIHFDFIDREKRIDNDIFRVMPSFLSPIYKKMIDFHGFLTGYEKDPLEYRKQLISYNNGSFFALHQHDYEPQKYGFITLLTKRGRDYSEGGTKFYYKDKMLDTSKIEDIGDMFIFKYDLIHEVAKVSTKNCEGIKFNKSGAWHQVILGRQTALIPWIEKFSKVAVDVD